MTGNVSSERRIEVTTQVRSRAGSALGDLSETKKIAQEMIEEERRLRIEKTQALRALRLARPTTQ